MEEQHKAQDQKKNILIAISLLIVVLLLLTLGYVFFLSQSDDNSEGNQNTSTKSLDQKDPVATSSPTPNSPPPATPELTKQVKSPHFVSSNPAHGTVLEQTVSTVTINFDFDLGAGSEIEVLVDGTDLSVGTAKISANKLSLSTDFNPVSKATYTVKYSACWPDGSCHPGSFVFSVK